MVEPDGNVRQRKNALRTEILAARSDRSEAQRAAADAGLAALAVPRLTGVGAVAAYLSFGTEPPTGGLIAALLAASTRVVVPAVDGEGLDWVSYDGGAAPAATALGVPQPAGDRLGADALRDVDAVLVPALAADQVGHRLGRGRGYYDRALASVTALVVAVVYDDELLPSVPVEAHDHPVNAILTPSAWIDVPGGHCRLDVLEDA